MPRSVYPQALLRLVNELTKLPTIGEKSALRLAYHLVTRGAPDAPLLARAIEDALHSVRLCEQCYGLSEQPCCSICDDPQRDRHVVCVVEKPADMLAIERSGSYEGLYHVLHGLWAPLRGITPEMTRVRELIERLRSSHSNEDQGYPPITELVLATSTTVEGDATALYIAQAAREFHVSISRIAQGLPKGGELEYADDLTLTHAIHGRKKLT